MPLLKELRSLFRLIARTPRSDKAITFYSEEEGYFAYFEGLVEELTQHAGATICYLTSDAADPILATKSERVRAFHLDRLLPFYMLFCRCQVFVMTLTDLHRFHLRRSIHPVHYVYAFHALGSTHMVCREGAFDHYDSMLCPGPHHVREVRRREQLAGLRPKQLIEAGYPRLDRICRARRARAGSNEPPPARRIVLVAPSWHAGNLFDVCGVEPIEVLAAAGFHVIVRLHPETRKRAKALVAALASRFCGVDGVELEQSVLTDESLLRADVLVTDWSCVAFEFAFGTERPVIHVDVPRKVHNPRYQELDLEPFEVTMRSRIGVVVPPAEVARLGEVAARLVQERATWGPRIAELRAQHVFAPGQSARIGAEHILKLAGEQA